MVDGCEEISSRFVVSGCEGSVLLEASEEVFDEMASLVEIAVERSLPATVGFGRDDSGLGGCRQGIENPPAVASWRDQIERLSEYALL